jgi:hypothetical protein
MKGSWVQVTTEVNLPINLLAPLEYSPRLL